MIKKRKITEQRRKYSKEYGKIWVRERRAYFFKDKKCIECGSIEKLELDHIKREGKIANSIWSWTEKKRIEEIKKCQILCKKCHRIKTNKENTKTHCIHGHDISIFGRDTRRGKPTCCKECRRIRRRKNFVRTLGIAPSEQINTSDLQSEPSL